MKKGRLTLVAVVVCLGIVVLALLLSLGGRIADEWGKYQLLRDLRAGSETWNEKYERLKSFGDLKLREEDFRSLDLSRVYMVGSGREDQAAFQSHMKTSLARMTVPVEFRFSGQFPEFTSYGIKGPDFTGSLFAESSLRDAIIPGGVFNAVSAQQADFSRATIVEGSFRRANLDGAKFHGAMLACSDFFEASLRGTALQSAILNRSNCYGADFSSADLRRVALTGAKIGNANFEQADLSHAIVADLVGWESARFRGANIFGVRNPPPGFVERAIEMGAVQRAAKR